MRKLFRVILPPFVGFTLFFLAVRYSSFYFTLTIGEIGEGKLTGFMAYYRYALPLLFLVAVLTQYLIAIPVWKRLLCASAGKRLRIVFTIIFVCLIFAFGLSYPISDTKTNLPHFLKLSGFMTGVQLIYWVINALVLFLLTDSKLIEPKQPKPANEE